jgi:hypothetical protein
MMSTHLETPVVFIIFNRPETTRKVFEQIAIAKPKKLFVIADGPRPSRHNEFQACLETRKIIDEVNWDCDVQKIYSETNLGCKNRIVSGLNIVFDCAPEVIVLEDDCVPDQSFFPYCEALLEHYRNDDRVGLISGNNFLFEKSNKNESYYFSQYPHIWGWASWRRVWNIYDPQIRRWQDKRNGDFLSKRFAKNSELLFWRKTFDKVYTNQIDTWDFQMVFSLWANNMCSIVPTINLVKNIGFGRGAAHARGASLYANIDTGAITIPLVHPKELKLNNVADAKVGKHMFTVSIPIKIMNKMKAIFKNLRGGR